MHLKLGCITERLREHQLLGTVRIDSDSESSGVGLENLNFANFPGDTDGAGLRIIESENATYSERAPPLGAEVLT